MSILDPKTLAPRSGTIYPKELAGPLGGLAKRALGDVLA
jgi:hypothetical protein